MDSAPPQFDAAQPASQGPEHHGIAYRVVDRALMVLNGIGTIWIFVLMFLICADVVARSAFNHPIDGVTDISAFSIIGIVFLQLGATVHTGRMTKGDVLLEMLSNRSKRAGAVMESVFLLVGAVMFSLVIWAIWPTFIRAVTRSEFFGVEGVFTFPTWPIRLIIVVGSAAAVLAYLLQIGQLLRNAYAPPAGHLESKVAP